MRWPLFAIGGARGGDRKDPRPPSDESDDGVAQREWDLILSYVDGIGKRDKQLLAETARQFDADDVNKRRIAVYVIVLLQMAIVATLGDEPTIEDFHRLASKLLPAWSSITGQDLECLVEVLCFSFGEDDPADELESPLGIIYQAIALALLRRSVPAVHALRPQLARYAVDNKDGFQELGID